MYSFIVFLLKTSEIYDILKNAACGQKNTAADIKDMRCKKMLDMLNKLGSLNIGSFSIPYPVVYLAGINLLTFLLQIINGAIKNKKEDGKYYLSPVLIILSVLGGPVGVLLGSLCTDRKGCKENMMLRVTAICMTFIYAIAVLIWLGQISETHRFAFWQIFVQHRIPLYVLGGINLITLIIFGIDKFKAVKESDSRIPVAFLLLLSGVGGSIGGLLAMFIFRHKIRKPYFIAGVPMIIATQVAVLLYIINSPWFQNIYI